MFEWFDNLSFGDKIAAGGFVLTLVGFIGGLFKSLSKQKKQIQQIQIQIQQQTIQIQQIEIKGTTINYFEGMKVYATAEIPDEDYIVPESSREQENENG